MHPLDQVSRAVHRRGFKPRAADYRFTTDADENEAQNDVECYAVVYVDLLI